MMGFETQYSRAPIFHLPPIPPSLLKKTLRRDNVTAKFHEHVPRTRIRARRQQPATLNILRLSNMLRSWLMSC